MTHTAEKDAPELRVEIVERIGEPTVCKVWRGERLIFDGVDKSVLARVLPPSEGDKKDAAQAGEQAAKTRSTMPSGVSTGTVAATTPIPPAV